MIHCRRARRRVHRRDPSRSDVARFDTRIDPLRMLDLAHKTEP